MTTCSKCGPKRTGMEALVGHEGDQLKRLIQEALQEILEAEMTEVLCCFAERHLDEAYRSKCRVAKWRASA